MHSPWKAAGLVFLNLLAVIAVIVLIQPVLRTHLHEAGAPLLALACVVTYLAGVKFIERRSPVEFASSRALPETTGGLALGFALFSVVMGILWAIGLYHPAGRGSAQRLLTGLLFALLAGIMEEILFRGLLFRLCSKIIGTWGALVVTSALFGLAHAKNPGATVTSSLAIALEAGILLGAVYTSTQRLWLPIGLHVGWNFTEGSVYGMSVSGTEIHEGLLRGSLDGPRLLTGGAFGPEASVVAVLVCLVVGIYFLWRTVKLHRVEPPIFSRPKTSATIES